jgi:hypothetical protein
MPQLDRSSQLSAGGTSRRDRLRRAAPLVVPFVLVVVLLGPHLVGLRSLSPADMLYAWQPWASEAPAELTPTHRGPFSDNFDSVFPSRRESVERLRSLDWPLWAPYAGGGSDLASNIGTSIAAPSTGLSLFTPGWYAPALIKAVELFAAWGFVFLFLRRVGVSRWPATFGGTVFAMSGFQVVWVNWPHTRVAALVAGVLWAFDRLLEKVEPSRVAVAALITAATVLEGFPAVAAVGIGSVAVLLTIRLIHLSADVRDAARRALAAGAAVMIGAGLTAVVMVPFGFRLTGSGLERGTPSNLDIARGLGTLLSPNALGAAERYFGPLNYIEVVGYVGAPALVVIGVSVVALLTRGRPDHRGLLLGVTAAGGAVMVLYSYGIEPIYDLFRGLPVLASNPAMRVKAAGLLWLALAAGLGLDALVRWRLSVRSRWCCGIALVLGVGVMGAYLTGFAQNAAPSLRDYVTGEVLRALIVLVVAALAVAVLVLRPRWPRSAAAAVAVLVVVAVVDSVAWVLPYWPRSEPEEFYPTTPAHEFLEESLGEQRFASLALSFFPGTSTFYEQRNVGGHVFFRKEWLDLLTAAGVTMSSSTFASFDDPATASSPVLDRLGVAFWADPAGTVRCEPGVPVAPGAWSSQGRSVEVTTEGPGVRGVTVSPAVDLPAGTVLTLEGTDAEGEDVSGTRELPNGSPAGAPVTALAPRIEGVAGPQVLRLESSAALGELAEAPRPCMAPDDGLELVHMSGAWIYRRTEALPRVRVASEAVVETDPAARVELLASGTLDDDTVVLSEDPGRTTQGPVEWSVESIEDEDPDVVTIRVESSGPGYLVVADSLGPGWQAEVDGTPVELLAADHAAAAVPLQGGDEVVTLRYEPRGLRAGVAVSGVSLLAVGGLLVASLLGRRRRSADPGPDPDRNPDPEPDGELSPEPEPAAGPAGSDRPAPPPGSDPGAPT